MNDLLAFLAVARDQSFTKAAAKLGVTRSAISHTIRALEARLGVRLLARTTRNVSPTEAGEKLMHSIGPLFDQIVAEVEVLGELRDKPAGTIRITCSDDAFEFHLRPMLSRFLGQFPDINVEATIDYGFSNIVNERYDAGIRMGESISKDMVAVRIGPDWRLAVVGAPEYFKRHSAPKTPQDLTNHTCINSRHSPTGGLYAWEFEKGRRKFTIRVGGQFTSNSSVHIMNGAIDGMGLAYVPEHMVKPHLTNGLLNEVLADWCPYFQGYHLYYPNRRQQSPAFAAFVKAMRH